MELYETEEQQVEAIKKWWRENGQTALMGATIGIVVILGWNYWQQYRKDQALQASALFYQLENVLSDNKKESAEELAGRINNQFKGSDYAAFSNLLMARQKVQEKDFAAAKPILEQVMAGSNMELANIARIRLVRLMMATKEFEQGLKLINEADPTTSGSFSGIYDELVGDLYVALDRLDQARTSYESAVRNGQQSPLLQMKMDDLAVQEKSGK